MFQRFDQAVHKPLNENGYVWLLTLGAVVGLGFAAWAALLFFPGQ